MSDEVSKEDLKKLEEKLIGHEGGYEKRHEFITDRLGVLEDDIKDVKGRLDSFSSTLADIQATLASIQATLATKRSTVVTWVSVTAAIGGIIWGMYGSGYIDFPSPKN